MENEDQVEIEGHYKDGRLVKRVINGIEYMPDDTLHRELRAQTFKKVLITEKHRFS